MMVETPVSNTYVHAMPRAAHCRMSCLPRSLCRRLGVGVNVVAMQERAQWDAHGARVDDNHAHVFSVRLRDQLEQTLQRVHPGVRTRVQATLVPPY